MTSQVIIATPMPYRFLTIALTSLATVLLLGVQSSRTRPNPADYPANSAQHGITIAVRPIFDTPEAEKIFGEGAAPTSAGFLPIEIVVWNERVNTVEIDLESVIIYSSAGRFEQATPEFIALNLYPPSRRVTRDPTQKTPVPNPLPIPIPHRSKKRSKAKTRQKRERAEAELSSRWLRFGQAAPGGYLRGYLYFDLRESSIDAAEAAVMIPGARDKSTGERLLFPEISLRPYE